VEIQNKASLKFHFLDNGNIKSIQSGQIRISLKEAILFSNAGMNIYLRKRNNPITLTPLLGPGSNSRFAIYQRIYCAKGHWEGLDYRCILQLSEETESWQWEIELKNTGNTNDEIDLIYAQDIGLKTLSSGLVNEYYVSQYLERLILEDESYGKLVCCRQNMIESGGHPWLMLASENGASSASTDGMLFWGKTFRATGIPEALLKNTLGGEYAGESSFVALQERPFVLAAGQVHTSRFIGCYLPDHPDATTPEDLKILPKIFKEFNSIKPGIGSSEPKLPVTNLFDLTHLLPSEDLNEEELSQFFGNLRRHEEIHNGKLLSFFYGDYNHVVLRAKEILADRPHAHIMQANTGLPPNENIVSTTAFMFGVFNSHITQGNTNFNTLLSVCRSQFNQSPESGQRIFVETEGRHYLLGVPSAFEMGINHCRWIYKFGDHCFQVRTWTSRKFPQVNLDFQVLEGNNINLIITHDFDPLNGWQVLPGSEKNEFIAVPESGSMITSKFPNARFRIKIDSKINYSTEGAGLIFSDGKQRGQELFLVKVNDTNAFSMSIIAEAVAPATIENYTDPDQQFRADCLEAQLEWRRLSLSLSLNGPHKDIDAFSEILPWYGLNALIHYLTPYGLEQFSGAAWGTRDVSQGPVDLLINLRKYAEARKVLCIIFSNQNPDGGWPQWWMFDSYQHIRAHEAHGDIFYWCIIALSNYIKVTGDFGILNERLPYYHENGEEFAEPTLLSEHVDRLIKMITDSFIPGTALVPFGGGDWNDSLQPVSNEFAERLISSWTVEMNYQAFNEYREVCMQAGFIEKAAELGEICARIKSDFNKHLIRDGIVAGYGLLEADGSISVLLHPTDQTTGIHYSILPMNRGIISGIFTREQAEFHQQLIEQHLKGPDGARLMDRPLKYKGGIQTIFQRAESSTFFGREIGLMYMHEHIRYAEALSMTGKAAEFVKALRQAIPVAYQEIVPCGDIRQSNCYYSSSDVAFKSRYEADERYHEIKTGKLTLRGGWRVYSSGPGIYIGLIISRLLGIRIQKGHILFDPVLPKEYDGLKVKTELLDRNVILHYQVRENTHAPKVISVNGTQIPFEREHNLYRQGGAVILQSKLLELLNDDNNTIRIEL